MFRLYVSTWRFANCRTCLGERLYQSLLSEGRPDLDPHVHTIKRVGRGGGSGARVEVPRIYVYVYIVIALPIHNWSYTEICFLLLSSVIDSLQMVILAPTIEI